MSVSLDRVGQYITDTINLTAGGVTRDITTFVAQTVIYEDMFSNVLTGYMVITDAGDLINKVPIIGTEMISVAFRTPGMNAVIEKDFYISSLKQREVNQREQSYVIHLIGIEGFIDTTIRLSKKFTGKTSDLIERIYKAELNINKDLYLEEHTTSTTFVCNYWSPLKAINWLSSHGYRDVPNTLFFESNKAFYCMSIDRLIKIQQQPYAEYTYTPTASSGPASDLSQYFNIKSISRIGFFDALSNQDFGYFSSNLITHDIVTKEYYEYPFEYSKKRKGQVNMEGTKNFNLYPENVPQDPNNFRRVKPKSTDLWNNYTDPKYESWAQMRNSLLYEAQTSRFVIEVHGRTDIEVGKVIKCNIPKSVAFGGEVTSNQMMDPLLSGKYLITHIRHEFTLGQHTMLMEIMKDSYNLQQ